jgi:hypothetical protein
MERHRLRVKSNISLSRQINNLNKLMARYNVHDLVEILSSPFRLMYLNFLAGLSRGFGIAVGLTLVAGLFLTILAKIASLNLPIIGRFIAEIVRLVENQLRALPK